MQRRCVTFNKAVRMRFKVPLTYHHSYNFISFHNLEYSERYRIIHDALKSYHHEFLDYIKDFYLHGRHVDYAVQADQMPKVVISEAELGTVKDEFEDHMYELQRFVKDIVREFPIAHP
ncbi:hypothetical protein IWQ61_003611 [Dispira simplex]|nr:hypothetical protein IWQ61_003611 [Dispira simplex]